MSLHLSGVCTMSCCPTESILSLACPPFFPYNICLCSYSSVFTLWQEQLLIKSSSDQKMIVSLCILITFSVLTLCYEYLKQQFIHDWSRVFFFLFFFFLFMPFVFFHCERNVALMYVKGMYYIACYWLYIIYWFHRRLKYANNIWVIFFKGLWGFKKTFTISLTHYGFILRLQCLAI